MAEKIEVVIKIDKDVKDTPYIYGLPKFITEAIANGTVLPKGHGDLVDREWLLQKFTMGQSAFYSAPIILKADSEV